MREQLLHKLKEIVSAVSITGYHGFTFNGEPYPVANQMPYNQHYSALDQFGANLPLPGSVEGRNLLINQLSLVLYQWCYCFPFTETKSGILGSEGMGSDWTGKGQKVQVDREFVGELSRANQTEEGWDWGWIIYHLDEKGQAFASKNGQVRQLQREEFRFADPQRTSLTPTTPVHIRVKKEDRQTMPGFYFMYGQEQFDPGQGLARFYWHIRPEGVSQLVRLLSTNFNRYRLPFWFKCLNHRKSYRRRADSAVLYLGKPEVGFAARLISRFLPELVGNMEDAVPLFTRRLAPGLAFAEDPMDGTSFGQHRCLLLARGLVLAWEKNVKRVDLILKQVEQVFLDHGIALDRPYLNSNSHYLYALGLFFDQESGRTGVRT